MASTANANAANNSAMLIHRYLFGIKGSVKNSISFADENIVVYPCGHNVIVHNMESKEQQFIYGMETGSTGGITALCVSATKICCDCRERREGSGPYPRPQHTTKEEDIADG
uniref:Uncharacterized protein n=1 Tax=Globisporangium ultimum (strain ATCC 200006 / CBS 805.95 / DAOM BR144) TaxID=431595 RepID=K3WE96_GLOUD